MVFVVENCALGKVRRVYVCSHCMVWVSSKALHSVPRTVKQLLYHIKHPNHPLAAGF